MSKFDKRPTFDSTSAAGAMLRRQVREPVLVGFMLAGLGTSTLYAFSPDVLLPSQRIDQTSAGDSVSSPAASGAAIGELRRLSGLTWDQLARLFTLSRRSLHFWASGKPMAPSNEEHLQRLLAVVRKVDRGSASANRAMLLGVSKGGILPFDLLVEGEYERVLSLLGNGESRRISPPTLSKEARAARAPRPPEELVDARHDRIHPASGRLRATKAVSIPRGK
jgi:DNA-binding transcriptional regulator YiaG